MIKFLFRGSFKEGIQGVIGVFATVEDIIDRRADRHFHAVLAAELHKCADRIIALGKPFGFFTFYKRLAEKAVVAVF